MMTLPQSRFAHPDRSRLGRPHHRRTVLTGEN